MLGIARLDHFVLTVQDLDATISFYVSVMGMDARTFGDGRQALHYGDQKINLHVAGQEFEPKAQAPTPGSADLCFVADTLIEDVLNHLESVNVQPELGPVNRTGALGPIRSVYIRDPDGNLIEISSYAHKE